MNAQEFEALLSDLENRVDRLRALYENWFRGYEKIEPQVARKDVERRVYALRKELPRNTALRFRYHQLFQRYTTLANYWQRTARQIEEGTYRLQVARMRRRAEQGDGRRPRRDDPPGPRTYELDFDESLSVDDLLSDLEMDEVARAVDRPGSHHEVEPRSIAPRAPKWLSRPPVRPRTMSESPFTSSDFPTNPPPAHSAEVPKVPKAPALPQASGIQAVPENQAARSGAQGSPMRAPPAPSVALASGTLSLPEAPSATAQAAAGSPQTGTLGAPPPGAKPAPTTPTGTLAGLPRPAPAAGQTPPAAATGNPSAGFGAPPPTTGALPGLPRPRPGATSGAPGTGTSAGLPRPTPSTGVNAAPSPSAGTRPGLPPQGPSTGLKPGLPPAASGPGARPAEPTTGLKPGLPPAASGPGARPAEPTTGLKPGLPPAASGPGARPPGPTTGVKPGLPPARGATSAGQPRPEPTTGTHTGFEAESPTRQRALVPVQSGATKVGRPPPPPGGAAAPSEQRLRRLYEEYVAARRRNNEGEVRYDTLVSSIQRMLPELQKKHQGKRIDFEVVVKDGRVGLKPKAL